MGIEPTFEAWEAPVLPLNYTRLTDCTRIILRHRRKAHSRLTARRRECVTGNAHRGGLSQHCTVVMPGVSSAGVLSQPIPAGPATEQRRHIPVIL
jgi:hypothetical protein